VTAISQDILGDDDLRALLKQLNEKQRLFCEEYSIDRNGKQAAIRAGYSAKTAEAQASRLLRNEKVSKYAAHLMAKATERCEYGAAELLQDMLDVLRVAKESALAGQELLTLDGEPVTLSQAQAIAAFKGMADSVGKHVDIQAWKERFEVEHKVDHASEIEAAIRRAEEATKARNEAVS
jgi:phage terminase small subunit